MKLSVREIQGWDITYITNYWLSLGPENLEAMGADPLKLPGRDDWTQMLQTQINLPLEEMRDAQFHHLRSDSLVADILTP